MYCNFTLPATTSRSSHPGGVNRWRQWDSNGRSGDITDDSQRLLQGLVGSQYLVSPLGLLLGLIH